MANGGSTILNFSSWRFLVLYLGLVNGIIAQRPGQVIAFVGSDVHLTFRIPDTDLANNARYISLKLDRGTKQQEINVVYFMIDGPVVVDDYLDRLTVTRTERRVQMLLRNVSALDAGTFRCYSAASINVIANCGQLLVIIRKPNQPTVKILKPESALEGSNLQLLCEASSASVPPNHGLVSEIFWFDLYGDYIDPSKTSHRIRVNIEKHLVIGSLQRADAGLKFSCTTADRTGDPSTRMVSEHSPVFEVITEYTPNQSDLRLTPEFQADTNLRKTLGELVMFKCDAKCVPSCNNSWHYRPYGGVAGFGEIKTLVDKKILTFHVSRINEGSYRCVAQNKHGSVFHGLYLEALYITNPKVSVNGQDVASVRVIEGTQVDMVCLFDSNPGPFVSWMSPSKAVLHSEKALGPIERLASSGIHVRAYTSSVSLTEPRCEESGLYTCEGENGVSFGKSGIHVMVMCSPTSAGLPGLDLLPEYVWDIPHPLTINFVIRALPQPEIVRIISTVDGKFRQEVIPKDFAFSRLINHDGKHYLTKFILTSRRNLDMSDSDRIFTMTIESTEFKKDFSFMIRPRGPPREITNLTAAVTGHESVYLSWTPGFNGGETQTFSVHFRVANKMGQSQQQEEKKEWTTVQENIPDTPGSPVQVRILSLKSSTAYVFKVTASNKLGDIATELQVETSEAPEESLGSGWIVGIVLLVLIVVALVIGALYFLVYKKIWGKKSDDDYDKDDEKSGELKKPVLSDDQVMATLLEHEELNNTDDIKKGGVGGPDFAADVGNDESDDENVKPSSLVTTVEEKTDDVDDATSDISNDPTLATLFKSVDETDDEKVGHVENTLVST